MKKNLAVFLLLMILPVLRGQEVAQCPCCSEKYRGFDFWIGEWEVTLADGSPAGTNRVESIQGGCALQEHWESARPGFTGTSFTFYNGELGQWEQLWLDNSGNVLKLSGGPRENAMVLASDPAPGPDGALLVNRITWSLVEDGRVRQLWEVLRDGEVVRVLFDGYYKARG
jgi:hypothetical protein